MLAMRPAVASDVAAVEAMIYARCGWPEERGLPSWRVLAPDLAEPAYSLYTSVTDPAYQAIRPGTLMAWWAVDKAARDGRDWARRGCLVPGLMRYYRRQGWCMIYSAPTNRHSEPNGGHRTLADRHSVPNGGELLGFQRGGQR